MSHGRLQSCILSRAPAQLSCAPANSSHPLGRRAAPPDGSAISSRPAATPPNPAHPGCGRGHRCQLATVSAKPLSSWPTLSPPSPSTSSSTPCLQTLMMVTAAPAAAASTQAPTQLPCPPRPGAASAQPAPSPPLPAQRRWRQRRAAARWRPRLASCQRAPAGGPCVWAGFVACPTLACSTLWGHGARHSPCRPPCSLTALQAQAELPSWLLALQACPPQPLAVRKPRPGGSRLCAVPGGHLVFTIIQSFMGLCLVVEIGANKWSPGPDGQGLCAVPGACVCARVCVLRVKARTMHYILSLLRW